MKHGAYIFACISIGIVLSLAVPVLGQTSDLQDDPMRQPHLKAWSNVIPNAAKRFVVLADFNNEAVLDRETQLVWERGPFRPGNWSTARAVCADITIGNRKGWRLPSVFELATLIDPSVPNLTLPVGHPFAIFGAIDGRYWSATVDSENPANAWSIHVGSGHVSSFHKIAQFAHFWCVRGGQNHGDTY